MKRSELLKRYFAIVSQQNLHPFPESLRFYLQCLFQDVIFLRKKMLDVGGGIGLFSFYAGCSGATKVVCLEPEAKGSSLLVTEKFQKLSASLNLSQVHLEKTTVQDFDPKDEIFDIILLHNSINHLDEASCINLQHDSHAIRVYKMIFQKLSNLASKGAKLIIADCSRYNFFALCNLKNPFDPDIEWHKHQSPYYWAKLLSDVGFCNPKVRWTSFVRLGRIGRLLLGNKFASYFLDSHFCLTMEKSG